MILDLAVGIAHSLFWFAVVMLELFVIIQTLKWLTGDKLN
jgi:hypothetical protein